MTATLVVLRQCPVHELHAHLSRESAEHELLRRTTSARLSGRPAPDLTVIVCEALASPRWHVRPNRRSTPRDRALALVEELRLLCDVPQDIDAGVVPGTPSELCDHDHPAACEVLGAVRITTLDPLGGDRVTVDRCYAHAVAWVRWLLEDPHRHDHAEPAVIDVEVQVLPA
ncbi:MAG TPA: hypothetical protein VGD67_21755 [Pseudonocardiaceae bacterium]